MIEIAVGFASECKLQVWQLAGGNGKKPSISPRLEKFCEREIKVAEPSIAEQGSYGGGALSGAPDPTKSQFFFPMAIGQITFLTRLLSIDRFPVHITYQTRPAFERVIQCLGQMPLHTTWTLADGKDVSRSAMRSWFDFRSKFDIYFIDGLPEAIP